MAASMASLELIPVPQPRPKDVPGPSYELAAEAFHARRAAATTDWLPVEESKILSGGWRIYLAWVVVVSIFATTYFLFMSGAHSGTDQDGYLMTARNMVDHGRIYFEPEDPFQFAGRMCVMVDVPEAAGSPHRIPFRTDSAGTPIPGPIYAKYPPGYPFLAAIGRYVAGPQGMYVINPLFTALAVAWSYFLFRTLLSPFASLMGVIWLAANPLTLFYANDSNSHATTLFCVVVGFWGLLSLMKNAHRPTAWWRGFIGAFALGYACTIRYSEALLLLPVLFVAVQNLGWKKHRWVAALATLLGWAIPIGALALICWHAFGEPWRTGYSLCKEDTGFGLKYFLGDPYATPPKPGNWETLVQQINRTGLFLMWPLAMAGLAALWGASWRVAGTLLLWVVPSTTLYLFYYWAPGGELTTGYLRFFMSVLPGLILAGLWFTERALLLGLTHIKRGQWSALLTISVLTLATAAFILWWFAPDAFRPAKWQWAIAGTLVLLLAGVWWRERSVAAVRVNHALALALITMFAAFINLWTELPGLEANFARYIALRDATEQVRDALPPGAALFADESTNNQLDSIGGYHLFDAQLFLPKSFDNYQRIAAGQDDDPNPIQRDRARFYLGLLGHKNAAGTVTPKTPKELQELLVDVIARQFEQNRRVAFLIVTGPGRKEPQVSRALIPNHPGWKTVQIKTWRTGLGVPDKMPNPRWPAWQTVKPTADAASTYVLYEVEQVPAGEEVKKPKPPVQPATPVKSTSKPAPTASTAPATRPATAPATAPAHAN